MQVSKYVQRSQRAKGCRHARKGSRAQFAGPERARTHRSHGDHIGIVVPKLPGGRQPLLLDLEPGIPLPRSGERLIAQAPADRFLADARPGHEAEGIVQAGVEGDGGRFVEEGHDEDVVVKEFDVIGQRQGFVDAVGKGRLRAVEHEDILLVFVHLHRRLSGLEGAREELGHLQEGAVIVEAPIAAVVFVFGGRVGRADVRGFAPVVPGDDLDEVGLEFEQV